MSIKSELQEIQGIGPAKSEQIVEIVEAHSTDSDTVELVEEALDYLDEGRPGYAKKFLARIVE